MSKRRIALVAILAFLAVVCAAVAAGGAWLFYTSSGLQWLAARGVGFAGKGLDLDGVAGTLAGGARIKALRYAGKDIELRIQDAALALSPLSLITLSPHIRGLSAARVEVTTKPGEPRGRPPDTLALPIDFSVSDAHIGMLVVDMGEGPLELTNVRVDYAGGESKHRVADLSLSVMGYAISLRGEIEAQPPFALKGQVALVRHEAPPLSAGGTLAGNLTELTLDGAGATQGAQAIAKITMRPFDEPPLAGAQVRVRGLDLSAIDPDLPRTAISGEIDIARRGELLAGPVRLENAIPGPYDRKLLPVASLHADAVTNFSTAGFTDLRADLGKAGLITGSGEVAAERAVLTLKTQRLDLKALHTSLRETHLAGRAGITLAPARQSVTAELRQDDIALALTAHRAGDTIEVPQFRASARGGVASGAARVSLAGQRPFSVDARLSRFDPAAWGDFPAGSVNATVDASGTIEGPAADLRIAIRDSRWLGAPLSGTASARVTPKRLARADVAITLGGNRFTARGALGSRGDALEVRFDAPRLDLVDRALSGRVQGSVVLSGELRAPRVQLDASGSNLRHKQFGSVKAVQARGVVTTQAQGPLELHASAIGMVSPQLELASAKLDIEGSRAAHTALLQATGDRIALTLRARGGLQAKGGWSGTLLELVNRGEVPVELAAPVALTVAPQRVHAGAFELRVLGGRLAVNTLDYARGRVTTSGTLQSLPVARLISLAGKNAPVAGTLRISGGWNLASTPQLTGTVRLTRDSGDLSVGAERRIALGLKALSAAAELGARGMTFQARLDSALASASAQGRIGAAGGGVLPYSAASPLELTGSAEVARLSPFASFIETAMVIEGAAQARLTGSGTLGDPQITGRITARDLAVALPAEGVSLTGGTLDAVLTPREIRLERFSIRGGEGVFTAQGTLARTGLDRASVDWRAERFTALMRPDRRLVVSGKGNAALENGKISLTGALRANEGAFEIGAVSALPTLSEDVVIVGRERRAQAKEKQAKAPRAFAIDVRVDLGNQVHVTGHGLSVWLAGDVRVYTNAQGDVLGQGKVRARDGTFAAYGQRLVIDRGFFYFNGPIANPALDILAMRKRQAVEAGVAVTGTLRNPLVRVVSDPPLPQGEALSWLILGRAPGEAGAGELSALPLATGMLAGRITDPLKQRLKLDELGLRGSGAVGEQFLTLGKRITERLYIAFEQSLGAAENLLRLEYTLTRRIVLRLQAGEPTSAGIFYRRSWD